MNLNASEIFFSSLTAAAWLSIMAISSGAGEAGAPSLVPLPVKMESRPGVFMLGARLRVLADSDARETGRYLADRLNPAMQRAVHLGADTESARGNLVLTTRAAKPALGAEGYELTVTEESIVIRAPHPAGLFYGVQTLLELLPAQALGAKPPGNGTWAIPCVRIEDQPRFPWRGLLLDVARHFFTKREVEQLMDSMAFHKLNHLQLHLTDDQAWRIEIKKYPRLTQVGAWRKSIGFGLDPKASTAYGPDGRYGGYYTQADIRELVAYAASRHITLVPEIEMPGHSSAALAAYPQLSCTGEAREIQAEAGIFTGVYCPGNEPTFQFLDDVLAEVIGLFPGKYIHIGGDEVPKRNWHNCPKCQARIKAEGLKDEKELQSYFVRRIERFINSKGRSLMGWSEILQGGLARNAAVMDWIGGGVDAASAGHDVVMTPTAYCYLDHYQSTNRAAEPLAFKAFLPLQRVYSFEPLPAKLPPQYQSHVLGAQGNLWTEYVPSFKQAQYMIYPRSCALSEIMWSPKAARDYAEFKRRLRVQCERLDQLGVNYRKEQ